MMNEKCVFIHLREYINRGEMASNLILEHYKLYQISKKVNNLFSLFLIFQVGCSIVCITVVFYTMLCKEVISIKVLRSY